MRLPRRTNARKGLTSASGIAATIMLVAAPAGATCSSPVAGFPSTSPVPFGISPVNETGHGSPNCTGFTVPYTWGGSPDWTTTYDSLRTCNYNAGAATDPANNVYIHCASSTTTREWRLETKISSVEEHHYPVICDGNHDGWVRGVQSDPKPYDPTDGSTVGNSYAYHIHVHAGDASLGGTVVCADTWTGYIKTDILNPSF